MNLKQLFLIFALLLPLTAVASGPGRKVSRSEVSSIISEYRHYDGVEVVKLGWLATAALKGVVRHAGNDEDTRQIREALRGIKSVTVLEYEDASPDVRHRLNSRIAHALDGRELLMEAKDSDASLQIFGVVDESTGTIRDFILNTPGNCALICLFGSLPMETVSTMMSR